MNTTISMICHLLAFVTLAIGKHLHAFQSTIFNFPGVSLAVTSCISCGTEVTSLDDPNCKPTQCPASVQNSVCSLFIELKNGERWYSPSCKPMLAVEQGMPINSYCSRSGCLGNCYCNVDNCNNGAMSKNMGAGRDF